ncbi:unnamed protein product [Mytilus coruscus]|uniref:Uncharacterized protein n=1 Tax=Mytilus coruscus TaxID=42192 RepID=A0A6J8C9L5_MYTCO|nr:unnamed protein product [Mytilus coruscus]
MPDSYKSNHQAYVSFSFSSDASVRAKRSTVPSLPRKLSPRFVFQDELVNLDLITNRKLLALPPIHRNINGEIIKDALVTRLQPTERYYQDLNKGASFHVECRDPCIDYTLTGSFTLREETYFVSPTNTTSHTTNRIIHRISKPDPLMSINDFIVEGKVQINYPLAQQILVTKVQNTNLERNIHIFFLEGRHSLTLLKFQRTPCHKKLGEKASKKHYGVP